MLYYPDIHIHTHVYVYVCVNIFIEIILSSSSLTLNLSCTLRNYTEDNKILLFKDYRQLIDETVNQLPIHEIESYDKRCEGCISNEQLSQLFANI